MPEFKLKDWYGKEKTFDKETIYVSDTEGNLQPFTFGTGASPDIRYVTFMSYDGLIEYGKKAVAVGDDCADPIARGVFSTPTRESDVQYNYTFYGWATEPNGGADANWNKAITEDKTVYANFSKAVRYYTITFYDDDGTVLKSQSLAYGSTPSYTPTKEDHAFGGWTPSITTVTGNASYTAVWIEKVTFADGSWDSIIAIAESGQASQHFAIGDTKKVTYAGSSKNYELTVTVVGFDHDDLSDGTGKAGMSIICMTPINNVPWCNTATAATPYYNWASCYARTTLANTTLAALPSDLQAGIKSVKKVYDTSYATGTSTTATMTNKLWIPSATELGMPVGTQLVELGTKYEFFPTCTAATAPTCTNASSGAIVQYWTRSIFHTSTFSVFAPKPNTAYPVISGTSLTTTSCYVCFGFCI